MGVPGFVKWIRKIFKDAMILNEINNKNNKKVKTLYLDGNCLVHPKCYEILANLPDKDIYKMEENMFERIIKFISYLVGYVNPEICYFAIDGVGPAAKLNQQRFRRFKSILDNEKKTKIKEKYKIKSEVEWSNTVITPGTKFMEKLHKKLDEYFSNETKKSDIKYIYSSYLVPGEGEHKIVEHIRLNPTNDDTNYVIYGLDADLFFLSMSLKMKNIYLLREEHHLINGKIQKTELYDPIHDVAEDMRYVSIDITKECYNLKLREMMIKRLENENNMNKNLINKIYEKTDYCDDFVFICYLLGNDFLPHLPTIDINKNGLDIIIDAYIDTYFLLNMDLIQINEQNIQIENIFLMELFRLLGNQEHIYYNEILPKFEYLKSKRTLTFNDEMEKEIWMFENLKNIDNYFNDDNNNLNLRLGDGPKDLWKFKYYEHYFNTSHHMEEYVNLICKMYLEGLKWITEYYFKGCISWNWKYPFTHAPYISDMYKYLSNTKNYDINKIKFNMSEPLNVELQLMAVLPRFCSNLMKNEYKKLMEDDNSPIIDMYPLYVKTDFINKELLWMCTPELPFMDLERLKNATKNIKSITVKEKDIYYSK